MMMKKHFLLILPVFILFSMTGGYAQDTLKILTDNAGIENKKLFVVFGHEKCSWCRLMEKYHQDTTVSDILSKYYVISKIDILASENGKRLYEKYGKQGTPSWTIFDKDGNVLVDSDGGNGNVGYPAEESELAHYVLSLQKTSGITDKECDLLVSKLKEYRAKKMQNN